MKKKLPVNKKSKGLMIRRYKTSHLIEDQYESGSQGRVLKNILGIKRKREIDRIEASKQFKALVEITKLYGFEHQFTKEMAVLHGFFQF